jgi:hypothetical protein
MGADAPPPAPAANEPPLASTGVIEKFRIPERDAAGDLIWLMEGDKARIIEEGRIQIFNVQLETYRKGTIDQTLRSSECYLIRQSQDGRVKTHAESTNAVEITGKNILITADGFQWFPDQTRLVMKKNVQVTVDRKKKSDSSTNAMPFRTS